MASEKRIGLVGTGLMGQPVARRLAAAGYPVAVWNRTKDKAQALEQHGVTAATTIAELVANNDVIICLLSDVQACNEVLFNEPTLKAAARGSVIIMMSTLSPDIVIDQQQKAHQAGLDYIDLPLSGGTRGAENGTLSLMAGGAVESIESLRPLLSHLGKVTRVGDVGAGQLAKLANQIIVAGTLTLLSEAFTFAEKGGACPIQVREALLGGFADSTLLQQQGERMVHQDFTARGSAKWQLKDTRSSVALAKQLGLRLPLTETINTLFSQMIAAGDGELDHCAIIRQIQRLNGIEPR